MKLILENFGAIQSCTIDLTKKHYLFVGYNNTGKTFLAKLLGELLSLSTTGLFAAYLDDKNDELISAISAKKEEILAQKTEETFEDFFFYFVNDEFINLVFEKYALFIKNSFIEKHFSLNKETLFVKNNIDLKFKQTNPISKIQQNAKDKQKFNKNKLIDTAVWAGTLLEIQVIEAILQICLQIFNSSILLPANRLFILEHANDLIDSKNLYHKKRSDLFEKFVSSVSNFANNQRQIDIEKNKLGLRPQSSKLDFWLQKVEEIRSETDQVFVQNGTGYWDTILTELAKVMGGDMQVAPPSSVSYNQANFKPQNTAKGEDLPLFLSSSSVNQLSLLYLYLKYWASSGYNFLIIDEPEQNLHPKNQLALLEVLLSFASVGENRILLTTHSPLFAEMFNNYLLLGHIKDEALREKAAQELGLKNLNVTDENTGIYFFNGTKVIEQKIGDYGVSFQAFKEAKERVYDAADYLGDIIYKQNQ